MIVVGGFLICDGNVFFFFVYFIEMVLGVDLFVVGCGFEVGVCGLIIFFVYYVFVVEIVEVLCGGGYFGFMCGFVVFDYFIL